jgi:ribosomal protein S27AE
MSKKPQFPHRAIVDFILSGKTTKDAKHHFGFPSDNVANTQVWAAFKALGLERPVYSERRQCEFCGKEFTAERRNRQTCGSPECQRAFIQRWQQLHPEKGRLANLKFKRSEKGRSVNRQMHRRRRERDRHSNAEVEVRA